MLGRPCRALFGEGNGGNQFPGGDPGQHRGALSGVIKGQKQIGGQDGGRQVGRTQQCPAHLFGDDREFGRPGAGSAELFRDREADQSQAGHLRPRRGVGAGDAGHQPPHLCVG